MDRFVHAFGDKFLEMFSLSSGRMFSGDPRGADHHVVGRPSTPISYSPLVSLSSCPPWSSPFASRQSSSF